MKTTKKATKAAPKKAVKTAKPKPSKVPQFDNGGRAYFVIRELEDGGMNTQIHGEGAKVAAMLSAALKSQPELRMMLLIGLI